MPSDGSTATTRPASAASVRVNFPVPAARSSTVPPAPTPTARSTRATASSGYSGRPRSYAWAAGPNPVAARGSTDIAAMVPAG
jgi:hypothetical protein